MERHEAITELVAMWRKEASSRFCVQEKQRAKVWRGCAMFSTAEDIVACGKEFFKRRPWRAGQRISWELFRKFALERRRGKRVEAEAAQRRAEAAQRRAEIEAELADPEMQARRAARHKRFQAMIRKFGMGGFGSGNKQRVPCTCGERKRTEAERRADIEEEDGQ